MVNNKSSNKTLHQRLIIRVLLLIATIVFIRFLLWPTLKLVSPIIFAGLLAAGLSPLLNKIYDKIKIPKKVLAFIIVLMVIAIFAIPTYLLSLEGFKQVQNFAENVIDEGLFNLDAEQVDDSDNLVYKWINLYVPEETKEAINEALSNFSQFIRERSAEVLNYSINISRDVITHATVIIFWIFTFLMSFYFILAEYTELYDYFASLFSQREWKKLTLLKDSSLNAVSKYIKGVFHLGIICLIYFLIAFGIYGYPYAIVISIVCAILDILPIVGSVTMLVPWFIYEFIFGDSSFGFFLMIITTVFFVLRKILEPKVFGDATGLHPLVTLAAMFGGMKLFGVFGAIIAPIIVLIVLGILQSRIFDDWFLDIHEFRTRLRLFLSRKKSRD